MVFTDLDGTLLDHDTYRWDAASEALERLRRLRCAVVLASSKTAAEMGPLRARLGFVDWPAIVENGAGLLPGGVDTVADAARYDALRRHLDTVPWALRSCFRGFGDMSAEEVAEMTGLPLVQARLAKTRAFSEPGIWRGSDAERGVFLDHVRTHGVVAQQGGRFLTLSFGGNKADRVKEVIAQYRPRHTIALGDAPNDAEMLEVADFGVVIANPYGAELDTLRGEETGRIMRTSQAGPKGWNTAMHMLLDRLGLQEKA